MKTRSLSMRLRVGLVAGAVGLALLAPPLTAGADAPAYTVARVGAYGGEPSLTVDSAGRLYESSLQAAAAYRSTDQGATWIRGATNAYSSTGDDCLATDQATILYLCNLTITGPSSAPLQGDVYRSTDLGDHWVHGAGVPFGQNPNCATSCSPFGVDRDWLDAYVPPASPGASEVVLMYHDFYGPSHIWVNLSQDGGLTFAQPEDVLANLSPSAGAGAALAIADTACSTVPAAVKVAKGGPHPGRVYVAWIAADPSSAGSGCNLSQAQAFHNLFVAWADPTTPGGRLAATPTWTPQLAYDAGLFHDSSTPFVGFTLDNQGNPYFGFAVNNPAYSPATCAAPQDPQVATCEYDMYVAWSPDGGPTWDGGGGTIPGSAASAYKVNTDVGTHWFPAIAAAEPGHVAVTYLETSDIIPTDPNGKQHPGGCLPAAPNGTCTSTDLWRLWAGQTSDLLTSGGTVNPTPTWALTQVTTAPMHQGDICNLGIACPPTANRNLADFISIVIDPVGCAHIAYADDKTTHEVDSANQTAGCFVTLAANVPETPWLLLFLPVGVAAAGLVEVRRRRRRPAGGRVSSEG